VLFGAGRGTTSGSYCGRVQQFLVSVMPEFTHPRETYVAARPAQGGAATADAAGTLAQAEAARPAPSLEAVPLAPDRHEPVAQIASAPFGARAPGSQPRAPAASAPTAPRTVATQPEEIGWKDIAGDTLGDQIRTVLAAVGVCAVLFHGLRWLGRDSQEAA
jgi:hypothetical protein